MSTLVKMLKPTKMPESKAVRMPSQADTVDFAQKARQKAAKRAATEGRQSTNLTGGDYSTGILGS